MALSMGFLVVVVLVIAVFNGGFSFSPSGPSGGSTPTAAVSAAFANAGSVVGFTPRQPQHIPSDWTPNSSTLTAPHGQGDAPPAVRGGWITPDGRFVQLVESSGTIQAVLRAEIGDAGATTGSATVGADVWSIYPGVRSEHAWVRQVDGITFLITGSASDDAFRTVAGSVAG